MQYFFKQYGPYETLNGLVIWFQKPLLNGRGVSELLIIQITLPHNINTSLVFILKVSKRIQIKLIALIFSSLIILFLMYLLRNAFYLFY